jgi:hypothetical protein
VLSLYWEVSKANSEAGVSARRYAVRDKLAGTEARRPDIKASKLIFYRFTLSDDDSIRRGRTFFDLVFRWYFEK